MIRVSVEDDDLVQTAVDGLPASWETFLAGIIAREVQPVFQRLWYHCLQEEGRIQSRVGFSKEEIVALTTKTKRGKRFPSQNKFSAKREKDRGGFRSKDF